MSDDIVARLRDTTSGYTLRTVFDEAADEIERLRGELNAARAEVCILHPSVCLGAQTADAYAKARGWDCFKDEDAKAQ